MDEAFASRLGECGTIEGVRILFRQAIAAHGYTASACGAFLPTDRGPETHFFFQDWPPDWIELYVSRNFVAADYVVAESRRRISPFTWLEAKAERTPPRSVSACWFSTSSTGWLPSTMRSNVSV